MPIRTGWALECVEKVHIIIKNTNNSLYDVILKITHTFAFRRYSLLRKLIMGKLSGKRLK